MFFSLLFSMETNIPTDWEPRLSFFRFLTADWMKYVIDDIYISNMSIPGTHESWFLEEHPTEEILMCINQEKSDCSGDEFFNCFKNELEKNEGGRRFQSRIFQNNQIPKLRDIRGKILIFKRKGAIKLPCSGIRLDEFDNNKEHTNADGVSYGVQDWYDLNTLGDKDLIQKK